MKFTNTSDVTKADERLLLAHFVKVNLNTIRHTKRVHYNTKDDTKHKYCFWHICFNGNTISDSKRMGYNTKDDTKLDQELLHILYTVNMIC